MVKLGAIVYITESLEIPSVETVTTDMKCRSYQLICPFSYLPHSTKFFINFIFEVFTEVILKIQVFWYITPCRLVKSYRRFELSQDLHLQSPRVFDCVDGPLVLNLIGDLLYLMNMQNEKKCQKCLGLVYITIYHFPDSRPQITDRTVMEDRLQLT